MLKRTVGAIISFTMLMIFMLALSGCSGSKLSGTYVNESDNTEYLEFSGNNAVLRSSDNPSLRGIYTVKGNNLIISFNMGSYYTEETFQLNSSKTTINYGGAAFIKEKGWLATHWPKFVIGFLILGVIAMIYERITGRDLGDDIDSFGDRVGEAIDDTFDK